MEDQVNYFEQLVAEIEKAKIDHDKLFVKENLQAGRRYYACLVNTTKIAKKCREQLSAKRAEIRKKRNIVR
jgi:hypothetical protein